MAQVRAEGTDALEFTAGYSAQSDSNLFRVPSSGLAGARPRGDTIDLLSFTASLDKSYSLQRFQASASFLDYRYRRFDHLSFNALNYSAAWLWSVTPRVRGVLSTSRNETPTTFMDGQNGFSRNVRKDVASRLEGEADVGGPWRLLAGLERATASVEQPIILEGDQLSQAALVGVKYELGSGSSAAYRYRRGDGETLGLIGGLAAMPTHFDLETNELELLWKVTSKSTVSARAGYREQRYGDAQSRSFGGPVGEIGWQWNATAKTTVTTIVRRELASYQTPTSDFVATDRLVLSPRWQASAHVSVQADLETARRVYGVGDLAGVLSSVERRDRYSAAAITLEWRPINAATLSLRLQTLNNSSNYSAFAYRAKLATVMARFTF